MNLQLLYYRRFIDDAFAIMDCSDSTAYPRLAKLFNQFGETPSRRLHWKTEPPSRKVTFLDLTVAVNSSGTISTSTFQKPMNLHLFVPAHSAHPAGSVKGLVFSQLRRFWLQNTHLEDFTTRTADFFSQLQKRGHDSNVLQALFLEAASRLDNVERHHPVTQSTLELWPDLINNPTKVSHQQLSTRSRTKNRKGDSRSFLHLRYHPQLPARTTIQRLFQTDVSPHLPLDHHLTIAFARAPNLGDRLWRTRLLTNPGNDPSCHLATLARHVST